MMEPQLQVALQYGALGLLGMVLAAGLPILWLIARHAIRAFDRIAKTQDALLNRIDTAERAVNENVNQTRHASNAGFTALREVVAGSFDRIEDKLESVERRAGERHREVLRERKA